MSEHKHKSKHRGDNRGHNRGGNRGNNRGNNRIGKAASSFLLGIHREDGAIIIKSASDVLLNRV